MQGLHYVLMFTALTFLSWGAYGPLLRYGTTAMSHDGLKAFVGVGLAYFFIAVVVPFWILSSKGEKGKWTFVGTTYSIVAGSVGALGALGIILALVFKGSPVYVMPIVFGFAPVVNTLVTAWMGKTLGNIRPVFVSGIIAAALGAVGVLVFKPPAGPAAKANVHEEESDTQRTEPMSPSSGVTLNTHPMDRQVASLNWTHALLRTASTAIASAPLVDSHDDPTTPDPTTLDPATLVTTNAQQQDAQAKQPDDGQPPAPTRSASTPTKSEATVTTASNQPPKGDVVPVAEFVEPPPVPNPSAPAAILEPATNTPKPDAAKPDAPKPDAPKPTVTEEQASKPASAARPDDGQPPQPAERKIAKNPENPPQTAQKPDEGTPPVPPARPPVVKPQFANKPDDGKPPVPEKPKPKPSDIAQAPKTEPAKSDAVKPAPLASPPGQPESSGLK